ncbi:unnamed protein product [Cladocopium goreaui]|uniref:Uncharacterized protein n=1 Tax=Cladocopium goreaui TaxID=2562237 RepID=A0A9P1G2K8_9DINO|nr:unnamed protein product [Cladocopium goreaui]
MQVGEKCRIKWFLCNNSDDATLFPFEQRRRSIVRHPMNNRQQRSVKSTYVQSVKARGVCEGVRGEAWMIQPSPQSDVGQQQSPYLALSYGSLSEAFYQALIDEGSNPNLLMSLKRGLEVRLLHHRTPPDVIRFLIHYHNGFHAGSGTSFCELVAMVPDVEAALSHWKQGNGINWSQKDYENKCAQFIKDHAEFGELFPEWKLWESARYCHRFFSKLHLMSEFNDMMSKNVDFLHPRLHNGVVLQCIQHVTNSVTTSLYDGVSEQDHNFLILLLSKMCVPTLHANGESQWIFDVATKKVLVSRIYTVMTGSVVTVGKKKNDNKKRGADKENMNANKRARVTPGGKAKAKAKSAALAMPNIPDEKDLNSTTIECTLGVRNKLWIDDLLKCASHVSSNVASNFGIADSEAILNLKMHLIEMGLMFAFKEQIMMETQKGPKLFRKWSTMRPALKEHAQIYMLKVCLYEMISG